MSIIMGTPVGDGQSPAGMLAFLLTDMLENHSGDPASKFPSKSIAVSETGDATQFIQVVATENVSVSIVLMDLSYGADQDQYVMVYDNNSWVVLRHRLSSRDLITLSTLTEVSNLPPSLAAYLVIGEDYGV